MKFHCLLPVRDEADIIGQCLEHMLTWADTISVFDTGSIDDTWEIIQGVAAKDKRVKPLKKDPVFFSENRLRGWLFNQARQHMKEGDWFLRVDADEFHHIPPPEFVKDRLKSHETIVYHQYYDFRLLASEVAAWETGKETMAERERPIAERRRWFTPSIYSEPRLCRYRETMQWSAGVSFPYNAGFVARERLPIRHYLHRDPMQLKQRSKLRTCMIGLRGDQLFTGYNKHDVSRLRQLVENFNKEDINNEWRKFITSDDAEGLMHWDVGADLPEFEFTNHLAPSHKRLAQRIIHSMLLPLLDRSRQKWSESDYPEKIPEDVVRELTLQLSI